jgi:hypothetical protein
MKERGSLPEQKWWASAADQTQMFSWLACPFVLCVPALWQRTMILFTSITAAVFSASQHHRQMPPRSLAFDGVTPLSALWSQFVEGCSSLRIAWDHRANYALFVIGL